MNIEEIYTLLKQNSDVESYYPNMHSFSIAVVQRPVALMNKESVRDGVINVSSIMKEDCFACMNHELSYQAYKEKWTT
jgi:hypothetical protein